MSRKITNLKFCGQPMHVCHFGFWAPFVSLGAYHVISIHRETPSVKCYWEFSTNSKVVVRHTATGVVAARNAAQKWFADEREPRRAVAAKVGK